MNQVGSTCFFLLQPFRNRFIGSPASGENVCCDVTEDVGESDVAAALGVRQTRVVEPKDMQERGVKVMDCAPVFSGVIPVLVSAAVPKASFDAAACHPDRKSFRMMISSKFALSRLHRGCPAKLASPDDEGVIEQAPFFQIREQSCNRLVDLSHID